MSLRELYAKNSRWSILCIQLFCSAGGLQAEYKCNQRSRGEYSTMDSKDRMWSVLSSPQLNDKFYAHLKIIVQPKSERWEHLHTMIIGNTMAFE
ncbi:hypothetical protein GDO78_015438 [Eleutherodactylus coqui]|uniref:Secreted protein n=1 Tax=Eleutherodactylus coqui TaxID=57060 RepID=A0A8J6E3Z7_ELECQ|nr:hypothetical protein GDO78_015438 [Eleutherodactylus coqui]